MNTIFFKALQLRRKALFLALPLVLGSCGSLPRLPDDPFDGPTQALTMIVVNQTARYGEASVDKYWAGNVRTHGFGGHVCCYPGLKDWGQPVKVSWRWGTAEDKVTREVTLPSERHTAILHFPPGGPRRSDDMYQHQTYLCVILRDVDKAELAFSVGGCRDLPPSK